MTEPTDLTDLVKRYLDLWQDQWAAMATDPQTAEALARFQALIGEQQAALAPFLAALGGGWAGPDAQTAGPRDRPATDTPSGAAATPGPSGNGLVRLDQLDRRLAAVEARLARLEAGAGVAAEPGPAIGEPDV